MLFSIMQENKQIFVYGTLRQNGSAYSKMQNSVLVEQGIRIFHYKMYSCGDFPIVEPSLDPLDSIIGDIFEISSQLLTELDFYEDIENLEYQRIWDHKHSFYIYIKGSRPPESIQEIKNGDWIEFIS